MESPLRSMRTLRFLSITRAGRVTRIEGRNVLRLAQNPTIQVSMPASNIRSRPELFSDWGYAKSC